MKILRGVTLILGALAVLSVASLALSALLSPDISPLDGPVSAASLQDSTPAPSAELTIVKGIASGSGGYLDCDGLIAPGDVISYTIDFTNTGEITATGIIIVDDYEETKVANISGISEPGTYDGGTIVWELGPLGVGERGSVSYSAKLSDVFPPGSGDVKNTATISGDEGLQASDACPLRVRQPDLTVDERWKLVGDKDGDQMADPGDTIRYTIEFENIGAADATGVTIVDDYEEEFVASITVVDRQGEDTGTAIVWDLGVIEVGSSGSVAYEATLKDDFPPGSVNVENTITVKCDEVEPAIITNIVMVTRPRVALQKSAELALDVDEDGEIGPGDAIRYTIEYENTGDAPATGVTIVDQYDRGRMISVCCIEPPGRDDRYSITWDLGTLQAGASGYVKYEGTLGSFPAGLTEVRNKATIFTAELIPVSSEVSSTVKVVPTPTPEPAPVPPVEGPTAGIFAAQPQALILLLFVTGLGGVVGLIYAGLHIELAEGRGNERLLVMLEGTAVHLIICAVIVLALGGGIKSEAAAAILSAVAGYVFGRARGRSQE
ncbi:MAG TPA: hypothetical protein VMW58_14635 [Anaerolineae bacterium]|nr:hypothetical protein [Anaerolineae bacterium]